MNLKTGYGKIKRSEKIINVFIKYGLGYLIDKSKLKLINRLKKHPKNYEFISLPERMRMSLEELGPTFIKFGQVLSTRPDFLPHEFIKELEKLQDKVIPFDTSQAKAIVSRELGGDIKKLFKKFDEIPVASASLSQVHKAILKNGEIVAVKIQRPDIKEIIELDLDILKDLMGLVDRRLENNWVYHPNLMLREFKKAILKEIDFANEARNYDKFRANFKDVDYIKIPKIYWDMTTTKVLTMEFIEGTKINEITGPEYKGIFNPKEVALRGATIILKQIFEDGFFHADPHPANIFVQPPDTIAMLDAGRVGYVNENMIRTGANLLLAIMDKNLDRVMQCLKDLGILEKDFDETLLQQDFTELIENYVGIPLKELELRKFAEEITEVMVQYNLVFPSNLSLMINTFAMAETTGKQLDPDFNIVTISKPFMIKIVEKKFSVDELLKKGNVFAKDSIELIEKLPKGLEDTLKRLAEGKLKFELDNKETKKILTEIIRPVRFISLSMIVASIIIGSSLIMLMDRGPVIFGYPLLGIIGFIIAFLLTLISAIILRPRKRK